MSPKAQDFPQPFFSTRSDANARSSAPAPSLWCLSGDIGEKQKKDTERSDPL